MLDMLNAGYVGCWLLDVVCWILDMLDAEYSMLDAGFGLQAPSDRIAGLGRGVLMIESALTDSFSSCSRILTTSSMF